MSAKAGKRPLRSLTAHEKLDAIRRVHDGESKASVARDIGVPESTLRGWCKNEDKISYLSRQSSPDTDESLEQSAQIKRPKLDDSIMQPFNLSLKTSGGTYSPNSETRYGETYPKNEVDTAKTPLNLNTKTETPKSVHMTERERNRAELARLSIELGLNRPEMFLPSVNNTTNNLADLSANIGLLAQWNNLLMQQQQKTQQASKSKVTAPADTSTNMVSSTAGLLTTVDQDKHKHLPKEKQSVHESVWYWLKTQQSMLNLNQTSLPNIPNGNGTSTSATTPSTTPITSMANSSMPLNGLNGVPPDQSSWFWKWYKQFAYGQQHQQQVHIPAADKPILYQQLTKDTPPKDITSSDQQNAENLSINEEKEKMANKPINNNVNNNNKARSVLDNLLFNNNNNVAVNSLKKDGKEDEESLSQSEALEHGEKFLKWLEACSDPSVTAMQIMQFRTLLNNVRTGADRKNGDLQNKTKVKRK